MERCNFSVDVLFMLFFGSLSKKRQWNKSFKKVLNMSMNLAQYSEMHCVHANVYNKQQPLEKDKNFHSKLCVEETACLTIIPACNLFSVGIPTYIIQKGSSLSPSTKFPYIDAVETVDSPHAMFECKTWSTLFSVLSETINCQSTLLQPLWPICPSVQKQGFSAARRRKYIMRFFLVSQV